MVVLDRVALSDHSALQVSASDHLGLHSRASPFLDHPVLDQGDMALVGAALADHNFCHHIGLRNPDHSPRHPRSRHIHSRNHPDIDHTAGRIVVGLARQRIGVGVEGEVLPGR